MDFARDLHQPETPRLLSDGSWVVVEMQRPGGIARISPDGNSVNRVAEIERPGGLCVARDDVIWVAATHPEPALLRVTLSGSVEVVCRGTPSLPFLCPNDLCFAPDGLLYLTDSGIRPQDWEVDGRPRPDYLTAHYDGRIWQIDVLSGEARPIDRGIRFTNGIAVGADGDLYVNEMISGDILRYALTPGVGQRQVIGNVMDPAWSGSGFRGPDGMAFAADGTCYCTVFGQGDVTVIDKNGTTLDRIRTSGHLPTNVAFGPDGEQAIYVTEIERNVVERFEVNATGAPIYGGAH